MLSGLLLGLAFLTKYQGLVAGLVILASLPFVFYRSQFRAKLSRFPLLIVATAVIVIPACNPDLLFGVFSAVA
jgi:4-amino-4-deoxy-L-arabinose transferase-like glycosyltransferase